MNKIGVLIVLRPETDVFAEFKKIKDMGCECCQINVWNTALYTDEMADKIVSAAKEYAVTATLSSPTELEIRLVLSMASVAVRSCANTRSPIAFASASCS